MFQATHAAANGYLAILVGSTDVKQERAGYRRCLRVELHTLLIWEPSGLRRYDILKGDKTTVDGIVMTGDSRDLIHGREQAYEHDQIWCPACESIGFIVCTGPRLPSTGPDGRESALSGDLCMCKCEPSPFLLASQDFCYIEVDDAYQPFHDGRLHATTDAEYDEQVCTSGKGASTGYPFLIEAPCQDAHFGRLDSEGRLPRVRSECADEYIVYWGDEALERQAGR